MSLFLSRDHPSHSDNRSRVMMISPRGSEVAVQTGPSCSVTRSLKGGADGPDPVRTVPKAAPF